jgi:hypothetical protein
VTLTLLCLLVLTVMLPIVGLLTDLDRADTARILAEAALRDESQPS